MRFLRRGFCLALIFGLGLGCANRQSVAFFGLVPGEDPSLASYFADKVYWALSTDSTISPVPPQRWHSLAWEYSLEPDAWRLDQYRSLAQQTGARFFVLAFLEPFQSASTRIWWKPWGLSVRIFQPLRLKIYGAEKDSLIFDGVVAHEDSLHLITPWPYEHGDPSDPLYYDQSRRDTYAVLVEPTVRGIHAAVSGNPLPSAVFVKNPPPVAKNNKKK